MNKEISCKVESLFGEEGLLYSRDGGYHWWIKYGASGFLIPLTVVKTAITLAEAKNRFEQTKDIYLLQIEKQGEELLKKLVQPGDEWKQKD